MDQESLPQVLSAKALAGVALSGGKARGAKTEIKACYKTADLADARPPLNSSSGKRRVSKVKSWSELAYFSIERAIAADDEALAAIEAKSFEKARSRNASAMALLAAAVDQAGRARDWADLILKQDDVRRNANAKKLMTSARDRVLKAIRLALEASTGNVEAAETLVLLTLPDEPPVPTELLSTLEIKALADSANEDAGEDIVFVVSRTGPLEKACSVDWNASGTAAAEDFVTGADLAGTMTWAEGDGAPQRIEFVLNPDQKMEPTETLVVTLAPPVGAELGAATTATVGIVDTPAPVVPPAPKAYDQDLPYGGIMLGAACQDGAPGNQLIRNQGGKRSNALVMYLEHLGPIVCMQTENRVDHFPLGATAGGYSDHTVVKDGSRTRRAMKGDTSRTVQVVQPPTGGDLSWRVAKVTSPENSTTLSLEKDAQGNIRWAGQTAIIKNCARDKSWDEEWQKCGGTGHAPGRFGASYNGGSYPTIWFEKPIDPRAMGWKIGDRLAFCALNSAEPDSGPRGPSDDCMAPGYGKSQYSSVNMAYRAKRPLRKSTYPLLAYCGCWWNSFKYDDRYIPLLLVGHRDSGGDLVAKGNAYCGYAGAHELRFGGSTQIRQVVRIPTDARWAGRKLIGCDGGIWRRSSSTNGGVTMSIARAGRAIGGASDDGKVLGSRTFQAEDLLYGDLKNYAGSGDPHRSLKLADPVEVLPGEAYYITLAGTAGSSASQFAVGRMLNYLGRGQRGLLKADHQNDKDRFQARNGDGGSWQTNDQYFGSDNYLTLGLSLFFGV